MTHRDEQLLRLGKMVFEIVEDLAMMPPGEAFARRTISYNQGSVELFVVRSKEQADAFDRFAAQAYKITEIPGTKDIKQ